MAKYELTDEDVKRGINQYLLNIFSGIEKSDNPTLVINTAGSGAGKTGIELMSKRILGSQAAIVSSDTIALYHPYYEQILRDELPEDRYKITRKFVGVAKPIIYDEIIKNRVGIIHEKVLDKGEDDIAFVKRFKDNGYNVVINAMATDLFLSRLSCYKRDMEAIRRGQKPRGIEEAYQKRTHDAFVQTVIQMQELGLCDEVNVFTRSEEIDAPNLVYKVYGDNFSPDFKKEFRDVIEAERRGQRNKILEAPVNFIGELTGIRDVIRNSEMNPAKKAEELMGLNNLRNDFDAERKKSFTFLEDR